MSEPPRIVWIIAGLLVAVFLVIPFGGRDDWLGWFALGVGIIALVTIWGALLGRFWQEVTAWWRGSREE